MPPSTPAIQVKALVKRYGEFAAVNGIDLEVSAGECVGLLGPNGAGKTTTVEILEGLKRASQGEVRVLGLDWADRPDEIRRRIGILFQETTFPDYLVVEEVVRLFRSFVRNGLSVDGALELVQLREKRRAKVSSLSGGQRQRLAIAVALVGEPEVVFLDEPTTGLDPQSRQMVWDTVRDLKGRGRAVLLTTHYMEEAAQLCDRLVVVDHGQVIATGTPAELVARHGGAHLIELAHDGALDPAMFAQTPGLLEARMLPGRVVLAVQELHRALPAVFRQVEARGTALSEVTTRPPTLDDVFLALTGRSLRETAT
ncbi:MAG: ABC transporter ATP-binding protein [Myxococcota bacterium]|nr:ABC transporter ATP-binding protein [Myxococcota bacterium]